MAAQQPKEESSLDPAPAPPSIHASSTGTGNPPPPDMRKILLAAVIGIVALWAGLKWSSGQNASGSSHECKHGHALTDSAIVRCPVQPDVRNVGGDWNPAASETDRDMAYARLAEAVQIPTESFDDMPMDPTDSRWDIFTTFETYLRQTFPLFHKHLELEHVNTHGLLFTWKGKNSSLKPVIFMAHQDVVPINPTTLDQWTYPPFSAHLDSEGWVWGRGTTDMKSTLIAQLSATEKLLSESFKPERTILYSFGFDEEITGPRGAGHLSQHILKRYGRDGVSLILDEGFTGVDKDFGQTFARVGLAEKGLMTVRISISMPGGHASRPPPHTAIGIAGMMFTAMEQNPGPLYLEATNPLIRYLECAAAYGEMDKDTVGLVRCPQCWPQLAGELAAEDVALEAFLRTTQAITVVNGGIKLNALPEHVTSLTNYRIGFFETSQDVLDRLIGAISPIAKAMNMTLDLFGSHANVAQNVIRVETEYPPTEPAPLTPDSGPVWDLMGGTIKHVFPGAVVVPSAMTAFTDTQYYWDLSRHIYRFAPAPMTQLLNFHTVNERIHINAHFSTIRFFYKLINNLQGWQD